MPWTELLAADRITILSAPGDRDTVLDAAARLIAGGSPLQTALIADALRERERVGSTGVGRGVALPHARSNAFAVARGAFLRLSRPVDFGAPDRGVVDLVFAMVVPEDATQQHLHTLSELAERFGDERFRERLRDARDVESLRAALLSPASFEVID